MYPSSNQSTYGSHSSTPSSGSQRGSDSRRPTLKDEELDPALSEVSRKVIGSAIEIHRTLGPGFDKSVYDNALSIELKEQGVKFQFNHEFPVNYKGQRIGGHKVSFYVDDRFVVQTLADNREISGFDRDQLRTQLKRADLELGLIINFDRRRLTDGLVRVINPDKLDTLRGERAGAETM
ncbi:MAG: GxxExxY protein [Phycisphaerales bacterium]